METEEEPPTLRRYISNDPTPAALGQLLIENPNGLLVYRDEIVSLLQSFEREDNAEGRGFYLTGWNGTNSYTFDRIVRGMNLHIPAVCVSMLGSTQPGKISRYLSAAVRGGSFDDGFIQRFGLMVWPDVSAECARDHRRWSRFSSKAVTRFHRRRPPIFMKVATSKSSQHGTRGG